MIHVEVEQYKNNGLERETWRFWFDDSRSALILSFYRAETRLSKRHKWDTLDLFQRSDKRRNTIAVDNVPLPDDVEAKALKQFIGQIKVLKN